MLYDMMCNDIECLRAKRWFAIAIRHGQPGFAALRCSSNCCHQWHWPLAGNCVSRRASEFERNCWHLLFFFLTIYIYMLFIKYPFVPCLSWFVLSFMRFMSSSCIKNPLAQRLCPACQKPSTLRVPPSLPCSSDFNQLPGGKCMLLIVIACYCIIVPCDRSDRWCKS